MPRRIIAVLLLAPLIAWAECGFYRAEQTMTIVVSKKSNNKCFSSSGFKNAFKADLVASVSDMNGRDAAEMQRRVEQRAAKRQKLAAQAGTTSKEATLASATYYGQQ